MSGTNYLILAFTAGVGLGAIFFGGLWWTVARLGRTRHPGVLLAGGFLLRMALALGGFYLAARGGWKPLLASLAGFMLARLLLTRLTRPKAPPSSPAHPVP